MQYKAHLSFLRWLRALKKTKCALCGWGFYMPNNLQINTIVASIFATTSHPQSPHRASARRTAAATSLMPRPYLSSNWSGVPLSPKESFTATNSTGTGRRRANTWATASPRPPLRWCSSAVTTRRVLLTESNIASSSNGLMVCMLIISQLIPSVASWRAASMAFHTKWPVAKMLTSEPLASSCALPISKCCPSWVKLGQLGRPKRK